MRRGQYLDWGAAEHLLAGDSSRYVVFDFAEPGGRVWIIPEVDVERVVSLAPDCFWSMGAQATSVPLWIRMTGGLARRLPAVQYRRLQMIVRGPSRLTEQEPVT